MDGDEEGEEDACREAEKIDEDAAMAEGAEWTGKEEDEEEEERGKEEWEEAEEALGTGEGE